MSELLKSTHFMNHVVENYLNKFLVGMSCFIAAISYAQTSPEIYSSTVRWLNNTTNAYEVLRSDGLKTYYLKTDAPLRDHVPANKEVKIEESPAFPFTRTNSTLFDSLFSLAILEVQKASVSTISDPSFENSQCDCFETGEMWKYVWTRDTAYASDLGLAAIDPIRSMNSLLFKISGFRDNLGKGEQIVQDTGTGGSWPISTDRVVWSLGALETLKHLPFKSAAYNSFLSRSFYALKNTALTDRSAIFDFEDGLYTGEQSFLDWREQTYPLWASSQVTHIGMAKSLSTNVIHYMHLMNLVELAGEMSDHKSQEMFRDWAKNLKTAINNHFWDGISYRSLKGTFLDQRAYKYYDLLGTSLAVISGIANQNQSSSALNSYPQTEVGAPVIWPQHQDIPIYHNRSIWPFVTGYALKAAKKIEDPYLISSFIRSLVLGPAQNLSHMENYEFLTLRNYFADGKLSGPVVNSRRQLWSVAAYAGMVQDVIFGKEVKLAHIKFNPSLTARIRNEIFSNSSSLELNKLNFQGKILKVIMHLPKIDKTIKADAVLKVVSLTLNGSGLIPDSWIHVDKLSAKNELHLTLAAPGIFPQSKMVKVSVPLNSFLSTDERETLYAPRTPALSPIGLSDNAPLLTFHSQDHQLVTYHVYKNGKYLNKTHARYYLDSSHSVNQTACYSVVAVYSSGNESFPSEPFCYWPTSSIQHYPLHGPRVTTIGGAQMANESGRVFLHEWGTPDQKLQLEKVRPSQTGIFAVQLEYLNQERISTGITAAVKKITIINSITKEVVKTSIFMMPHHQGSWIDSNFVSVSLKKDTTYTIHIEDFLNMSYFEHFKNYKYRGGKNGPYNMANLMELKLLYLGQN